MIRHVVLMKLLDGPDAHDNGVCIQQGLELLVGVVDGLVATEVRLGFSASYDVCVVSDFASLDAYGAYGRHPAHQRMRDFIHEVVEDHRPAFDCEL